MARTRCNPERLSLQRLSARTFVVVGGVFWVMAAFLAERLYGSGGDLVSAQNALLPLSLTVVVFAIGWFWEYAVSALLGVIAVGVVVWGVTANWEPGVWMLVIATLIAPIVISGTLFLLAARMQTVCKLEQGSSTDANASGVPTQ